MYRFEGTVEFEDGTIEEFEAGNVALAAWERYAIRHKLPMGKDAPNMVSSLVIAHAVLGDGVAFDPWSATVAGCEVRIKQKDVTRLSLLAFLGLPMDADDRTIEEAVNTAAKRGGDGEQEVPPTRPGASTE